MIAKWGRRMASVDYLVTTRAIKDGADQIGTTRYLRVSHRFCRCGGWAHRTLVNCIQHDHRYLALGLELIVGVGRPELERLFPKPEAFLACRLSWPGRSSSWSRLVLRRRGSREYFDTTLGAAGAPPFEATTKVTAAVRSVKQREDELVAGLAAGGRSAAATAPCRSPRWGRVTLYMCPSIPPLGKIAVRVSIIQSGRFGASFASAIMLSFNLTEHTTGRRIGQIQEQAYALQRPFIGSDDVLLETLLPLGGRPWLRALERPLDLHSIAAQARLLEEIGYDGLVVEETKDDPCVIMALPPRQQDS